MWNPADYLQEAATGPDADLIAWAFGRTWRADFAAPGFCVIDLGPGVDSRGLRAWMLDLIRGLDAELRRRQGLAFGIRSLGRFDQQVTTRFHLDGAPDRSLLMLGYEPSRVASRLAMADYARCAHDLGITPRQFLDDFNPMYRDGAARLAPYATALPPQPEGRARAVLVNNSALPFVPGGDNPLGVLHQAEIPSPDETQRRVINSILLACDMVEEAPAETLDRFVATEAISGRVYG